MIVEEAQPDHLIGMAMRRVHIRFKESVDAAVLARVPGVSVLSQDTGTAIKLQVEGEMDGLIKALAKFPLSELVTENPSLEEIFLAYYEGEEKEVE